MKTKTVHMSEDISEKLAEIAATRKSKKQFASTKGLVLEDLINKAHKKECK